MKHTVFDITVKQSWKESYYNSSENKTVEYDTRNELKGKFSDWEQVVSFVDNVLIGFENAVIEINIMMEE